MLRRAVRALAADVIEPRAVEIDAKGEFPEDVRQALARQELLGLGIPAKFGGAEADRLSIAITIEEIARVCTSSSLIVAVQELGTLPIMLGGDDELKRRFLPEAASGKTIAAFALTEPGSGSDAAALETVARRDGDDYVVNGRKSWISNAGVADFYVVHAMTDASQGAKGLTSFVVEAQTPGFEVVRLERKMGLRGSPAGELGFDDCRIPARNRIGDEGTGFKTAMQTLDRTRVGIGAQAVGLAQGALDEAVSYAKERRAFGQTVASFQGIQFMLADMAMDIEAARGLVYRAAAEESAGNPYFKTLSAMAKTVASDVAMKTTTDAVQILGAAGYSMESPVARMMRDAKATQIYEGTNQIQRVVIARDLIG